MDIYVIIVAGGSGKRMGSEIPKQFLPLSGKPVLARTFDFFRKSERHFNIILVLPAGHKDLWKDWCMKENISFRHIIAEGGITRFHSVRNALEYVPEGAIVLVHDGVRPFVDDDTIEKNVETAKRYGNAVAVVDCVETLIHSADGISSDRLIPRDCLKRVLTPQSFKLGILRSLFKSREYILSCRDPSTFSLFVNEGNKVYCSPSNEKNFKITFPDDVLYFKKMFE